MDMERMRQGGRNQGTVLILVGILAFGLVTMTLVSVNMVQARSHSRMTRLQVLTAKAIAESGLAQAITRIKRGGEVDPVSGGGVTSQWTTFSTGELLYYTNFDAATNVSTVRAWGRIAAGDLQSTSTEPPDSLTWDGSGWVVQGLEVTLKGYKHSPQAPVYVGNGGIERPMGGIELDPSTDPLDPTTWVTVTSSPDSYQLSSVPFEASALDHPGDYLYNGGTPAAAASPHPYHVWASQNPFAQMNTEAWFQNSAGSGYDPTIGLSPPPTSPYYDTSDPTSPDYPYPIDPGLPDVQEFSQDLWNDYQSDPSATKLNEGAHSGTFGDFTTPGVTFVTGQLQVDAGTTFRGAGVLVIRDDYDPNVDTDNQPSARARLNVDGVFEWTGLVIIAGWAPDINVTATAGAEASIVGGLFTEDSVQSGSEMSLESAMVVTRIDNPMRILYSSSLFQLGGLVYDYLPAVRREVVGVRDL